MGQPKTAIHLRAVIELMEATLAPVNCDDPVCLIKKLRPENILFDAQQQFIEHVEQYTLADLAEPAVSITGLLNKGKRNWISYSREMTELKSGPMPGPGLYS